MTATQTLDERVATYLFLNGASSKRAAPNHAQNVIRIVESALAPALTPFSVSVDTEDIREGQHNDLLIVLAANADEAKQVAVQYVADQRFVTEVLAAEAYPFTAPARVVGRLINTDEE